MRSPRWETADDRRPVREELGLWRAWMRYAGTQAASGASRDLIRPLGTCARLPHLRTAPGAPSWQYFSVQLVGAAAWNCVSVGFLLMHVPGGVIDG